MWINDWFRSHPLLHVPVGAAVVLLGVVRGEPLGIAIGVLVAVYGLVRAFVF